MENKTPLTINQDIKRLSKTKKWLGLAKLIVLSIMSLALIAILIVFIVDIAS